MLIGQRLTVLCQGGGTNEHSTTASVIAGIQPGTLPPAALLPALDWVQGHLPPALDRLAVTNPVHAVELRGSHGGATAGKVLADIFGNLGKCILGMAMLISKPSHARHLRAGQYQNSWAQLTSRSAWWSSETLGLSDAGHRRMRTQTNTLHPQHECTRPDSPKSCRARRTRRGLVWPGFSSSSANNIHRLRRAGEGVSTKTTVSQLQPWNECPRAISRASKLAASIASIPAPLRNFWTDAEEDHFLLSSPPKRK